MSCRAYFLRRVKVLSALSCVASPALAPTVRAETACLRVRSYGEWPVRSWISCHGTVSCDLQLELFDARCVKHAARALRGRGTSPPLLGRLQWLTCTREQARILGVAWPDRNRDVLVAQTCSGRLLAMRLAPQQSLPCFFAAMRSVDG